MAGHVRAGRGAITRRRFLETSSGLVAVTISGVPALAQGPAPDGGFDIPVHGFNPVPGVARQRIDGLAKVTGAKIFARDFNARDMDGWPNGQWYAMYLRAITTTRPFTGLDLSLLPEGAAPVRIVYGDQLREEQRQPEQDPDRDLMIDDIIDAEEQQKGNFDRPDGLLFDLVVQRGNQPDFLGQAVALLIFDSAAAYRAARRALQFKDAESQTYGPYLGPNPREGEVLTPETWYVKYAEDGFSYATSTSETYKPEAEKYAARIERDIAEDPSLIVQDFRSNMQAMDPMFMEPESGIAWHDAAKRTLNIVLGTQSPDGDVEGISSMYGDPGSPYGLRAVHLTSCFPGGGFGGRDKSPFSLMLALASAFTNNNPVKLEYDRFEQFRVGLKRHAATLKGQLVVAPDMKMQAIRTEMVFDGGGRKNLSPYVASLAALCVGGSYDVPMADIAAKAIHTQNISGGSQRGFGGPQAFFAIETAVDDIARAQGWNPVEFRRANLLREGMTTVVGGPVDQVLRLDEMVLKASEHPLWADRTALREAYAARGLTYGTGLAMSLQAYGTSGDGVIAAVLMDEEGRLTVRSDAVDMGNGSATTLGVVVGPILGVNAETVEMGDYLLFGQTGMITNDDLPDGEEGNWSMPKWTAKSVGSSSACLTGLHQVHVVEQAALALAAITFLPAARAIWDLPELPWDATEWRDGALALRDGSRDPIPRAALMREIIGSNRPRGVIGHAFFQGSWVSARYEMPGAGRQELQLDGVAVYGPGGDEARLLTRHDPRTPPPEAGRWSRTVWAPCVNVIGLTVDRATGAVGVENVLSVLNAGKLHVEPLVSGQSQGGVAMALGYTLMEDMPPGMEGPADGRWNLNRYHVPRYGDVPLGVEYRPGGRAQELLHMGLAEGEERVGRGIAEAVMCSIAPAISNALRDAVGVRYTSLPITPEKILAGLGG